MENSNSLSSRCQLFLVQINSRWRLATQAARRYLEMKNLIRCGQMFLSLGDGFSMSRFANCADRERDKSGHRAAARSFSSALSLLFGTDLPQEATLAIAVVQLSKQSFHRLKVRASPWGRVLAERPRTDHLKLLQYLKTVLIFWKPRGKPVFVRRPPRRGALRL